MANNETQFFCNTPLKYDLKIKILAINLNDEDIDEDKLKFSVVVRFEDKCMEICPGDECMDTKPSKESSKSQASKKINVQNLEADEDDNESENSVRCSNAPSTNHAHSTSGSKNPSVKASQVSTKPIRPSRPSQGATRPPQSPSKMSQVTNVCSTHTQAPSQIQSKISAQAPPRTTQSRQTALSQIQSGASVPASTRTQSRRPTPKSSVGSFEEFGTTEESFTMTPNCMSQLLAKHCFKYEILKECQLYGELFRTKFDAIHSNL